jgi:hypothetical protein
MTKISWLTLFKEIITVYTENHTKQIQNTDLLIVKTGGTYNYHWVLNGQEKTKFGEYLLLCSSEYFVFPSAI